MEFIHVDDIHGQNHPRNESANTLSTGQSDGGGFRSFKIVGLAPDQTSTPTGMREEILLLSWLIVLLRTKESSRISYDWAYNGRGNGFEHEPVKRSLSTDEVMTGLQSNVAQIAAKISRHIMIVAPSQCTAMSGPGSLLLSTSSMSQTSEEAKDKVSD